MTDRTEQVVLDFEVDLEDSIESIDKLTAANRELRKERNALNLATESGKKRAAEINAVLDQNTATIRKNSSAIEQQRANIGNYRSALDGVHPALGKVGAGLESGTQGFKAMTLQALRFIATPIGAILAALVTVFTLLKAALSTNNALMDKFENITNAVGVVLEVVVARVGKLGEALIALLQGNFTEAINKTSEAFTGLSAEIGEAVKQQQLFLDLSRDLEDAQRALRIETARQENEIKRLVVAAKNQSLTLDEQEELLRRALDLEEQLVAKRAENAQKDLVITARRLRSSKEFQQQENETFDQFINRLLTSDKLRDDEVDKIVEKIEALEQARGSSLAFQEKVENSLAVIQEKRNKIIEEQTALLRANQRAQNQINNRTEDPLADAFQTSVNRRLEIEGRFNERIANDREKASQEEVLRKKREADLIIQIEEGKLAATANLLGQTSNLFEQDSIAFKVIASSQALINTYLAATAALASGSKINPVFGIISAAVAVANGLAAVARINGVEFEQGGVVLRGPSHAHGGIPIEAEGDEIILTKGVYRNPHLRSLASAINVAGGGRRFADGGLVSNSITQPINQQLELLNIVKNLPPQVLDVRETMKIQKRIEQKERISKR